MRRGLLLAIVAVVGFLGLSGPAGAHHRDADRYVQELIDAASLPNPESASVIVKGDNMLDGGDGRFMVFNTYKDHDVTPDGRRFLLIVPANRQTRPARFSIVQNWFEDLKARAPVP